MAKVYEAIDGRLREFIEAQQVFFVATAPTSTDGHINVSPKGLVGTFAILGPLRFAYLDYFGSGIETIAHLRENGRIVVMFCAFTGPPNIVRLHGTGRVLMPGEPEHAEMLGHFPTAEKHAVRSVIVVDVQRVSDSCGYSVPLMDYVGDRDLLARAHERRTADDFVAYADKKNRTSIDGLPGLGAAAATS